MGGRVDERLLLAGNSRMGSESKNPWMSIPASDYEAHMGPDGAKQLELMGNAFEKVLATYHPKTLAAGLNRTTGSDRDQPRVRGHRAKKVW